MEEMEMDMVMEQNSDDEDLELEEAILLNLTFFLNECGNVAEGVKWVNVPVDTRVTQLMGDPAFRLHFRMSRVTFEALHQVVGHYLLNNNIIRRISGYDVDLILMHTLWILATPDSFRSVAMQFNTTPATVYRHYRKIVGALCDLAPQYIKCPSHRERVVIENTFEAYSGLPGVIGAVDGTYMVVTAPTIQPKRYVDRHHQYSINTQAICDHNLLVRDLYVGEAGSLTDSRVFRRSPVCKQLHTNPDMIEPHQHLLGDSIYMLTDKLLTPFRKNGHLTRAQKKYNYCLSKCRVRIEHCFGKLFSQWRRLKFLESHNFEYAVKHIVGDEPDEQPDEFEPANADNDIPEDEDDIAAHLLEGDYDHLPEEFLRRNPIVRQLQQAKVAGRQKRDELVEHLNR